MLSISVVPATPDDLPTVRSVLAEAMAWLAERNMPLWTEDLISPERVSAELAAGWFYLAVQKDVVVGILMFQSEDLEFWSDIPPGESMFVHRLAVRRSFAGGNVSTAMLQWAIEQCQILGKQYLRLDCVADRARLRSIYEKFGFQHHSDKQVGSYFVARYQYLVAEVKCSEQ